MSSTPRRRNQSQTRVTRLSGAEAPDRPAEQLQLFDAESSTYTYLIGDPTTRKCALVDPVDTQIERDLSLISQLSLKLVNTLETHILFTTQNCRP